MLFQPVHVVPVGVIGNFSQEFDCLVFVTRLALIVRRYHGFHLNGNDVSAPLNQPGLSNSLAFDPHGLFPIEKMHGDEFRRAGLAQV